MQAAHHFKVIASLEGARMSVADTAQRLRILRNVVEDVRDGVVDRAHAHRMLLPVVIEALAQEVASLEVVSSVRLRNVIETLRQDRIRPTGR